MRDVARRRDKDNVIKLPQAESFSRNLNHILSSLMKKNKISLTTLFRNTGIAIPTIKRLQTEPECNPTITTLLPIANFFGITLNQLIGKELLSQNCVGFIEEKTSWLNVPIIKWESVLDWCNGGLLSEHTHYISTEAAVGEKPYAVIIDHDDWTSAGFLKESVLIIDSQIKPTHKDYTIVYKIGQSRPSLKQFIVDEDNICLKSLSPFFSAASYGKEHKLLGTVIQIRNMLKN